MNISEAASIPLSGKTPTITPLVPETGEIIKATTPSKSQAPIYKQPDNMITQIKDITMIYPSGEEVLKLGQPFLIEFKVKSSGTYIIYLGDSGNYTLLMDQNLAADSTYLLLANPSMLSPSNHYRIKVEKYQTGIYAESGEFTIEQTPWDGLLQVTAGDNSVSLKWNPIAGAPGRVGYNIYRGTAPNVPFTNPLTDFAVKTDYYTDNTAHNGMTYYYAIEPLIDGLDNVVLQMYKEASTIPHGTIVLKIGEPYMTVNGEAREIDPGNGTVPVIVNGRTFIPIRAIVESMGGTVGWDGTTQKVTINCSDSSIVLKIGSTTAMVNGTPKELDVAPFTSDTGRTMLPLRFITENLGCDVDWEWTTETVTITY